MSVDKYPQLAQTFFTSGSTVTQWYGTSIEFPDILYGAPPKGKKNVAEILQVTISPVASWSGVQHYLALSTMPLTTMTTTNYPINAAFSDTRNIFMAQWNATNTSGFTMDFANYPEGTGLLYPGDKIYFNFIPGTAAAYSMRIQIKFRIKSININEYLGIVTQYTVQ